MYCRVARPTLFVSHVPCIQKNLVFFFSAHKATASAPCRDIY